ncbi:hypothetical protein PUN28_011312 [Cardiocondyla obscurior]|uniref:Flavin-containing monooxygenase n=1 Tax=Cardiocondyla obscurior TaxID=286306 RepID=A0AAW2FF73_9HYME
MPSSKTKIAIVGGGVAGLVTARHMVAKLDIYSITLFEQTDQIGGTWIYTDKTDFDKHGLLIHSSMYKNLRTNIPKEIMALPDFPFQNVDGPSFTHHSMIREYLMAYAKHFNLHPYIKLNTLVKRVEPETTRNGRTLWTVTYKSLETKEEITKTFDAVVLCNGHYSVGRVPHIPGIESFHGRRIHSHQYRMPEIYAGKRVCILGASWSGIDIALEVSQYANKLRHINKLKERQWGYYDELAAAANVPSVAPVNRKIMEHVFHMRDVDFTTYKNYQYRIIDSENFSMSYCKPC